MHGTLDPHQALFSSLSLEERIPCEHPLHTLKILVDAVRASLHEDLQAVYGRRARPSFPPECLLQALLLRIFYTVRSERQLVDNLLFRWFVCLGISDGIRDHSTFSKIRQRLFDEGMARRFFAHVKGQERLCDEHFTVDGTRIEAWASDKSFRPQDGPVPPSGGAGRNFARWKPIEKQPIGWNPDLNEGVRLNIRSFLSVPDVDKRGAGVLRDKPNIKWEKDRGTDLPSAPWYELGLQYGRKLGDRVNDHHLTLTEKRAAHSKTGKGLRP